MDDLKRLHERFDQEGKFPVEGHSWKQEYSYSKEEEGVSIHVLHYTKRDQNGITLSRKVIIADVDGLTAGINLPCLYDKYDYDPRAEERNRFSYIRLAEKRVLKNGQIVIVVEIGYTKPRKIRLYPE